MRRAFIVLVAAVLCVRTAAVAQQPGPASFDSRGVRIQYEVRGAGMPVVLIHGFTTLRSGTSVILPGATHQSVTPSAAPLISFLQKHAQ